MPRVPLAGDSEGAIIVREEQLLLARVQAVLGRHGRQDVSGPGTGEGAGRDAGTPGGGPSGRSSGDAALGQPASVEPGRGQVAGPEKPRAPEPGHEAQALLPQSHDAALLELRDLIAEAKPEDIPPLVEQMARIAALAGRRPGGFHVPVDPASPYFAHLRLREPVARGERVRDVLIGKRSLIDREAGVQIVDWRHAPVSQLYYRYEEGDDYDEEIDGRTLRGVVDARRSVTIDRGLLKRIACPQGIFVGEPGGGWVELSGEAEPRLAGGQGRAARPPRPVQAGRQETRSTARSARTATAGVAPGSSGARTDGRGAAGGAAGIEAPRARPARLAPIPRADKHLPEIAALIDPEQFALITAPDAGAVIVQGGAGSGKTTVALHRVAYLVYHDPARYRPGRCLVIVPTEALERYVSGVLPSLGVTGVQVRSFSRWARQTRRRLLPAFRDTYATETPATVSRVKKHPALVRLIDRWSAARGEGAVATILGEAEASGCGSSVARALAETEKEAPVPRLVALRRNLGGMGLPVASRRRLELAIARELRACRDVVGAWAEMLSDRGLVRDALPRTGPDAVTDAEVAETVRWVSAQLDERPEDEVADIDEELRTPLDGGALDDSERGQAAGRLDPEDDAILLRLFQRLMGGLTRDGLAPALEYDHVVIDEAQDLAAIDVAVLAQATRPLGAAHGAGRSLTLAGDVAQRLVFDNGFRGWEALCADAGIEGRVLEPLGLSYRSTAEVMQFARAVLGPLAGPETPAARSGAPVELHRASSMGEAVIFLAEALRSLYLREPEASVALIARFPAQADQYYEALRRAEVPGLRRVGRHDFPFAPGVDVTDVAQVKGLEFDYAILLEVTAAAYPDTVEARHLLHIGATRAVHQLWLLSVGEPSPLLPPWLLEDAAGAGGPGESPGASRPSDVGGPGTLRADVCPAGEAPRGEP